MHVFIYTHTYDRDMYTQAHTTHTQLEIIAVLLKFWLYVKG